MPSVCPEEDIAQRNRQISQGIRGLAMDSGLLNYDTRIRRSGVGIADAWPRGTYSRTAPTDVEAEPSAASPDSAEPRSARALHMKVAAADTGAHPVPARSLEVLP
jgi:hypothetical protein